MATQPQQRLLAVAVHRGDGTLFPRFIGFIHRLVWQKHHGAIPDGHFILHRNGVTLDNRIANLNVVSSNQFRIDPPSSAHYVHAINRLPPLPSTCWDEQGNLVVANSVVRVSAEEVLVHVGAISVDGLPQQQFMMMDFEDLDIVEVLPSIEVAEVDVSILGSQASSSALVPNLLGVYQMPGLVINDRQIVPPLGRGTVAGPKHFRTDSPTRTAPPRAGSPPRSPLKGRDFFAEEGQSITPLAPTGSALKGPKAPLGGGGREAEVAALGGKRAPNLMGTAYVESPVLPPTDLAHQPY